MNDDPHPADQSLRSLMARPTRRPWSIVPTVRPPEEASSDDPIAQAQTILEDSEERTAEGAAGPEPTSG